MQRTGQNATAITLPAAISHRPNDIQVHVPSENEWKVILNDIYYHLNIPREFRTILANQAFVDLPVVKGFMSREGVKDAIRDEYRIMAHHTLVEGGQRWEI
jgi:hypothetical protein